MPRAPDWDGLGCTADAAASRDPPRGRPGVLAQAGVSLAGVRGIDVQVRDLPGDQLGLAVGKTVYLDVNAAGFGWFADKTPRSDNEFRQKGDQGEQGKMDLLTVLSHKLGHILGRDHAESGVMSETLATGTRESIVPGVHVGHGLPTAPPSWFLSSRYR